MGVPGARKSAGCALVWALAGVPGVHAAVPDVVVAEPASGEDPALAQDVAQAFQRRSSQFSTRFRTEVSAARITLRGTVATLHEQAAAAQVARDVPGVLGVDNLLELPPALPGQDGALAAALTRALREDPHLAGQDVHVEVRSGQAWLTGQVDSEFSRRRAEDLVARARGVTQLINQVDIPAPAPPADADLATRVVRALRFSPWVDGTRVDVRVEDGRVVLAGRVDTLTERQSAERIARSAGARQVDNQLVVPPRPKPKPR